VIGTEKAHEAVIVEGSARALADSAQVGRFISVYQRKYDWDMSAMKADLLSLKEPVFEVRPRVVFGLYEKNFMAKATRWIFNSSRKK
jgi:hypothetical protein